MSLWSKPPVYRLFGGDHISGNFSAMDVAIAEDEFSIDFVKKIAGNAVIKSLEPILRRESLHSRNISKLLFFYS
jgi:hypothetical protein